MSFNWWPGKAKAGTNRETTHADTLRHICVNPNGPPDSSILEAPGALDTQRGLDILRRVNGNVSAALVRLTALACRQYVVTATRQNGSVDTVLQARLPKIPAAVIHQLFNLVLLRGSCGLWTKIDAQARFSRFLPLDPRDLTFTPTGRLYEYTMTLNTPEGLIDLTSTNATIARFMGGNVSQPETTSPVEAAVPIGAIEYGWLKAMFQVAKQSAWPRINAKIITEKLMATMPAHIREQTAQEQSAWLNAKCSQLLEYLASLQAGEVIAHGDWAEVGILQAKTAPQGADGFITDIQPTMASALLLFPEFLSGGPIDGIIAYIQNQVIDLLREPVQQVLTDALGYLARLYGSRSTVAFQFLELELKPNSDLAGPQTMNLLNQFKLLAAGAITPAQFSVSTTYSGQRNSPVLDKLYANEDFLTKLLGIDFTDVVPSDTDGPPAVSHARPGDKRGDSETSVKRGKTPAPHKRGERRDVQGRGKPQKPKKGR